MEKLGVIDEYTLQQYEVAFNSLALALVQMMLCDDEPLSDQATLLMRDASALQVELGRKLKAGQL